MQKLKAVLSFFQLMLSHFRWKVILIILLGISFSVFQGVGIVMVIPLLEAFQHKAKSRFTPFFEYFNFEQTLGNLLLLYFLSLNVDTYSYLQLIIKHVFSLNFPFLKGIRRLLFWFYTSHSYPYHLT